MTKYYFLNFDQIQGKNVIDLNYNQKIITKKFKSLLPQLYIYFVTTIILFFFWNNKNKKEAVSDACFSLLIVMLLILINEIITKSNLIFDYEQQIMKDVNQELIKKNCLFFLHQYPGFLLAFMKLKNLKTIDEFVNYLVTTNNGLCSGYSREMLKIMLLNPAMKKVLCDHLNLEEIIKYQIHTHLRYKLNKLYSKEHDCSSSCLCHQLQKFANQYYKIENLKAINTFCRILNGRDVFDTKSIFNLFTDHLQNGFGFVQLNKMKTGGNNPVAELSKKVVISDKEVIEIAEDRKVVSQYLSTRNRFFYFMKEDFKLKQEIFRRKLAYIHDHKKEINLTKRMVSGYIIIGFKKKAHSMFYRCNKNHILFFDSNYGLYQYPSSQRFSEKLAHHLTQHYPNTETLRVETMLLKPK